MARRHRRLRLPARRGPGDPRRLERRPRAPGRAAARGRRRPRRRCSAAASCCGAGEVRLGPGESYAAPGSSSSGPTPGSTASPRRLHRWLRARPHHPPSPAAARAEHAGRPSTSTTTSSSAPAWSTPPPRSASSGSCSTTAGSAAAATTPAGSATGTSRRDVWPQGLRPLAERVRGLGMQLGLWFEPEMVNLDSDLVRAHPDWVLGPAGGPPPRPWRHQEVLDVAHPQAYAYLLERLSALVDEIGVDFLKWDHNRDLHESMHPGPDGVRRAGGPRADAGALRAARRAAGRATRGWRSSRALAAAPGSTSGSSSAPTGSGPRTRNDALERQAIQRWTGLLVPPELVGAHVGPPVAHTTGRTVDLGFRCLRRCSATPAWSGTSPRATRPSRAAARLGGAVQGAARAAAHRRRRPRRPARRPGGRPGCTGSWRPTAGGGLALVRLATSADRAAAADPCRAWTTRRYDVGPPRRGRCRPRCRHRGVPWWERARAPRPVPSWAGGLASPLLDPRAGRAAARPGAGLRPTRRPAGRPGGLSGCRRHLRQSEWRACALLPGLDSSRACSPRPTRCTWATTSAR